MICSSFKVSKFEACGPIAHSVVERAADVLAVVVLYNRVFKDVPCARHLMQWLAEPMKTSSRLNLAHCLIYDNSPVPQLLDCGVDERINLFHDLSNGGTRAAYLYALTIAKAKGYSWILFLDHDTDLPGDFFRNAEYALAKAEHDAHVCAVVPRVFDGVTSISPSWITSYGRVYAHQDQQTLAGDVGLTAIASASIFRTQSLAAVLPIPDTFSLDYLDHWLFREVQRNRQCIAISSARVEHSLSVQSMSTMSIDRYRAILAAELEFLRGGTRYSSILHLFWHMGRTLKLMLLTRRPALVGVCVRAALNILRTK
jgi:glycosyltransferase involved in cell wall biosynthesis